MKLQFLKTHEDAILPKKNYNSADTGDAALDVFSVETVIVPARGSVIAPVGLELAHMTPGFWFKIEGRSGLGFVKGIRPHGGVIDNSYRGEMGIKLYNDTDVDQTLEKGMAVAQLVPHRMIDVDASFAEVKSEGERGEKGFGSSDKPKVVKKQKTT